MMATYLTHVVRGGGGGGFGEAILMSRKARESLNVVMSWLIVAFDFDQENVFTKHFPFFHVYIVAVL